MNIYLVSRKECGGYDSYDSFVCYAETEESARRLNPCPAGWGELFSSWCASPEDAVAELVGSNINIKQESIILGSFNAG